MDQIKLHRTRLKKVVTELHQLGNAVMVLSSNPCIPKSRDTDYPYRPNSDLYYLTGSTSPDINLVISTRLKHPVLIGPTHDPIKVLWEGAEENLRSRATKLGCDCVLSNNQWHEIEKFLVGCDTFIYHNIQGNLSSRLAQATMTLPAHQRRGRPLRFIDSHLILNRMRLYKDRDEVAAIREAAHHTNQALYAALALIKPGVYEYQVAEMIASIIRMQGSQLAFDTIVATGSSAAVLHYRKLVKKIQKDQLVLVDWGAQHNFYCADISRTLPVQGVFTPVLRHLYETVLAAQKAAIAVIRADGLITPAYKAAERTITEGLVECGVLRGKISKLLDSQAYKPYFPHGISHCIGLDAHDDGEVVRNNRLAKLEAGMVITVEPGIYFAKPKGHIPACGIRIEDDVLVTKTGATVLTEGFPKEPEELVQLLS